MRKRVGTLKPRGEQAANQGLYMTPNTSAHDPKQTRARAGTCKPGGERREQAYREWGYVNRGTSESEAI
jgi:hypothetical protein